MPWGKTPAARAGRKRYWKRHPEKKSAAEKRRSTRNRTGETTRQRCWRINNPGKRATQRLRQRAGLAVRTPAWANSFFIDEIYSLAKLRTQLTGIEWEVDHIVPLRSPLVGGLHVEYNLRVIPKRLNRQKQNLYWPDMPRCTSMGEREILKLSALSVSDTPYAHPSSRALCVGGSFYV